MNSNYRPLWTLVLTCQVFQVHTGFGNPREALTYIQQRHSKPCDCYGGYVTSLQISTSQLCPAPFTQHTCLVTPSNGGVCQLLGYLTEGALQLALATYLRLLCTAPATPLIKNAPLAIRHTILLS